MLKRKSIATMMAAATVATSVAPVFAAETEADVLKRVQSVTTLKKGDKELNQLIDDLRFLLNEGPKFEVVQNGATQGFFKYEQFTGGYPQKVREYISEGDSVYAVVMTDKDGNTKIVKSVVEIENAIAELKSIDGDIDTIKLQVIQKGHAIVNGKVSAVNSRGEDIDQTDNTITIVSSDTNIINLNVGQLYDGEYLTEEGFELYSTLKATDNLLSSEIIDDIIFTTDYPIIENTHIRGYEIVVKEGNNIKEHTIEIDVIVDYRDTSKETEKYHIVITGDDSGHIHELAMFLNEDYELGASRLAGEDRFKTAIKIAKESTTVNPSANIVLVNAESMIDGLTATPLAKTLDAPILLTNKDSLQKDTLNYIKDVLIRDNTKVTIVGGEGVVSNNVVRELEKLGVKVERIGGADRHTTSVEVAIKLRSLNEDFQIDRAFIVSATGEADAMSIAPVASTEIGGEVAPIIVEGFDGMSTTANELLKTAKSNGAVDLIGGKISEETQKLYAKAGEFIYGADRKDTNAKVVEKYFNDRDYVNKVDSIYVAKDGYVGGNGQLVDALTVGMLAADNNAAVILATDGLSARQQEAIKSVKKDNPNTKVKQIGGGVSFSNTVKAVAKILGFTK